MEFVASGNRLLPHGIGTLSLLRFSTLQKNSLRSDSPTASFAQGRERWEVRSGRLICTTWQRGDAVEGRLAEERSAPAGDRDDPPHPGAHPEESPSDVARARQRVEAILLISREPLAPRKLAQLADLADATQARTLCRELNERYDAGNHAFRIEEVAGGLVMMTRPQFARWLRKVDGIREDEFCSRNMLETLAIVAYRQPVLRVEVEAIRGVGCDEVLKQLMERELVRICGRSEELGRPYLYGTTKRFLQLFGLKSLDRLPRLEWVRQSDSQ